MTMFKALMLALVLSIVSAAHGAEAKPTPDVTPSDRTAATTVAKPEVKEEKPAEDKEEFAGTTMIRFFAKTFEAAKECKATKGLHGSESIQIAAY